MNEETTKRYESATFFGAKLRILLSKHGLKPSDVAKGCNVSYSKVNNILNGHRAPNLEFIFDLSMFSNIPFQEIAFMVVDLRNIHIGEDNNKEVGILLLNNGKGPTVGTITTISEKDLKSFYKEVYSTDQFRKFFIQYLADVVYKSKYEEYLKKQESNHINLYDKTSDTLNNKLITDISTILYDMDVQDLSYIKEYLELYNKHKKI